MKKQGMAVLALFGFVVAVQAQQAPMTIDAALTKASLVVGAPILRASKVAVISYETPTKVFSDYVGESLTYDLQAKLNRDVISYRNVDTIHKDYKITEEYITDTKAIEIGKALKVDVVLLVNVKGGGGVYQLNILTLNITSGKRVTPLKYSLKEDEVLTELLKGPAVTDQEPGGAPVEGAVRRLRALREASN
jgi:hypothetical protein